MQPAARVCCLAAALALPGAAARAVPAPPFPLELRLPDGGRLQVRMHGDERLSWFEDLDGYSVAFDARRLAWFYAERAADGRLTAGTHRVGAVDPRALDLSRGLEPSDDAKRGARALRAWHGAPRWAPRQGDVPNLVLLVRFKNQATRFAPRDFEPVFNGPNGSVQHYWRETSLGKIRLVSTITDWIPLPNDDVFYAYNSENTRGRPDQMIRDAVQYLDAQGFDFTRFDADGDGVIDAVGVIHSGKGYETSGDPRTIHSHYAPLRGELVSRDGVRFLAYHTEPEFGPDGRGITQIGVIAHETAHFFGLPDLYDYGYDSGGLGLWSLMSAGAWAGPGRGGDVPTHLDAWSKFRLGFVEPVLVEQDRAALVLEPAAGWAQAALVDAGMPANQFFMMENRQRIGYDAHLPGAGLLIYHVDEGQGSNDDQNRYLVDLEQADGRRDLNRRSRDTGDATDPFPLRGVTAFTPETRPGSLGYGAPHSKVWVTSIRQVGANVAFDVELREPLADGGGCVVGAVCASGFCIEGVCCNRSCAGECSTCRAEVGAIADGTCTPLDGTACDDGNICTLGDACRVGGCLGVPRVCPAPGPCQEEGICSLGTGRCYHPPVPDGLPCDDQDACTAASTCRNGTCRGFEPTVCAPMGECNIEAVCDPASGACASVPSADGVPCSLGECRAGACAERKACGCGGSGSVAPLAGLFCLVAWRRAARLPRIVSERRGWRRRP